MNTFETIILDAALFKKLGNKLILSVSEAHDVAVCVAQRAPFDEFGGEFVVVHGCHLFHLFAARRLCARPGIFYSSLEVENRTSCQDAESRALLDKVILFHLGQSQSTFDCVVFGNLLDNAFDKSVTCIIQECRHFYCSFFLT